MKKSLGFWQFSGFIFTCILGTLLHFAFELSNENVIIGLFSAVNESIWEHIKLIYFPQVVFAIIENHYIKNIYPNFWRGKACGILTSFILIPTIYYTYSGILGVSADWFNILIFFITAATSFYVETRIIKSNRKYKVPSIASKIFILLLGVMFVIFTFLTPKIPLFCDPLNNTYGCFKVI